MADVIALSPFCQLLQCTYRRSGDIIGSSYSTGVERNIHKCHKLQDMSWNVTNLAVLNCPTNNLGDYKDPNIMIHQKTFKNTNQRKFSKLILQFLLQVIDIDVQANPVTPKLDFNSDPHRRTICGLRNLSQENYWNSENSEFETLTSTSVHSHLIEYSIQMANIPSTWMIGNRISTVALCSNIRNQRM